MTKKKNCEELEVIPAPDASPRKRKPKPTRQRLLLFVLLGTITALLIIAGILMIPINSESVVPPLPTLVVTANGNAGSAPTPLFTGEYVEDLAQNGADMVIAGSTTLRLYQNNQLTRLFEGYNFDNTMHDKRVSVAFRPGSTEFASLITRNTADKPSAELTVWNADNGDIIRRITAHEGGFSNRYWGAAVAFSPDGNWLATAAGDATIALWDAESGDLLSRFAADFVTGTQGLAFSADGQRLAATIYTGSTYGASHRGAGLQVWMLNNLQNPEQILSTTLPPFDLHWTTFSPDGRYFAAAIDRNPEAYDIVIWDLQTLTEVGTIALARDIIGSSIVSLAFRPDNSQLAFVHRRLIQASTGPGIPVIEEIEPRIFNWQTGQEIATGPALGMKGAYELRFSDDGTALQYIDANDNNLYRWQIGTEIIEMLRF